MATTSSAVNEIVVAESLNKLSVSSPEFPPKDLEPQKNPWGDEVTQSPISPAVPTPVDTSFITNQPETTPFEAKEKVEVNQGVLDEFDPLRNRDEQAAKDAWEKSESHPPPVLISHANDQTPTSVAANNVVDDGPSISRPTTPSFPGLAAIARSFSLPRSRNARPLSIDVATTISSPTMATFAQQQLKHTRSQSQQPNTQERQPQPIPASNSAPIPSTSGNHDNEKDQPVPFDFQKFLDQMKSKPAEPVAKYLRSYVC
jgi:hypothetical protein